MPQWAIKSETNAGVLTWPDLVNRLPAISIVSVRRSPKTACQILMTLMRPSSVFASAGNSPMHMLARAILGGPSEV